MRRRLVLSLGLLAAAAQPLVGQNAATVSAEMCLM